MAGTMVTPFSWGGNTPGHTTGPPLRQGFNPGLHQKLWPVQASHRGISVPGFWLQTAIWKPDPCQLLGREEGRF